VKPEAQGWYRDPYQLHQDRYFSAGEATKLVRDGDAESYDEPPDSPVPATDLVPVTHAPAEQVGGTDLRRADEAENESRYGAADLRRADDAGTDPPYSSDTARRRAFDAFDSGGYGPTR
jgi:hypothetical protein